MKIARIIPLFKSGDKQHFSNYRPISLLPQFSKILAKIFNNRLMNFLNSILWKRKYDKQQRCLHPRFNLHSSHKYIYSLRSQQSVYLCHNKSLSSSHYPWQHANFTVPWNHRPINNVKCQVHKFISSAELLCLLV